VSDSSNYFCRLSTVP